ncbi:CoA-binding domain-containing protein [Mycena kentingensis (nom. inval.)]|nr:CoA-binding domain-containing protein [Mycena kentingensis (nom. inval.)]
MAAVQQKAALFLSAQKFAVVGASTNDSKYGAQAFKWLRDRKKDAVPINLEADEVQGVKALRSLDQLPDPANTAVCIVVPPSATINVVKQAKSLNVHAIWVQPGAEDNAVVNYIKADSALDAKTIYTEASVSVAATAEDDETTPPCLLKSDAILALKAKPAVHAVVASPADSADTKEKEAFFWTAPKYAVVGASNTTTKNGYHALKHLVDRHKDVIPINLKEKTILGLPCLKSITDLPDITHTGIWILVPPSATLEVMKQVQQLNAFAAWIVQDAEDDAVVAFIESDPALKAKTVYRGRPLPSAGKLNIRATIKPMTTPPCQFIVLPEPVEPEPVPEPVETEPSTAEPASDATTVPTTLAADNLVAGVKRDMISPPSTPQPAKAMKLALEENAPHIFDLQDGIPGMA